MPIPSIFIALRPETVTSICVTVSWLAPPMSCLSKHDQRLAGNLDKSAFIYGCPKKNSCSTEIHDASPQRNFQMLTPIIGISPTNDSGINQPIGRYEHRLRADEIVKYTFFRKRETCNTIFGIISG